MLILGIESSCDETAAAIVEIKNNKTVVRSSVVLSQINTHKKFGGVVPEVAARKHTENILPVIDQALKKAKVRMNKIDRIAVTRGPGLITSLIVGVEAAKTLGYVHNIPVVGVNHLEGHLLVASSQFPIPTSYFPSLALIASGGHTELILVKGIGKYQKIGQTLDDAAGECFDKIAKILDLGYPGGPIVSAKAKNGNPEKFDLPSPMINRPNFDFSFAGLKTSVLYYVHKNGRPKGKRLNDFCAAAEKAIVDVLVAKTVRAAEEYKVKAVLLGGGVAANKLLRNNLEEGLKSQIANSKSQIPNIKYQIPNIEYCGDNAVMIALAGYYAKPTKDGWKSVKVNPNLEISM